MAIKISHPNRKVRPPKQHPEYDLQVECVDWFRGHHPNDVIMSIPNEAAYSRKEKFKKSGMLTGASDLVVVLKGRVIFIEMKSDRGRQSIDQRKFEGDMKRQGFEYYVCRSKEEFIKIIENGFNQFVN